MKDESRRKENGPRMTRIKTNKDKTNKREEVLKNIHSLGTLQTEGHENI